MTSFFAAWKKYKKYKFIGLTMCFPVLTPEHPRRKVCNARKSSAFVWCDCGSPSIRFAQISAPYLNLLLKRANILNCYYVEIKCQLDATEVFICRSYCLFNMFRASLCPSSGVQEYYTVVAACGIFCCKNVKIWA